MTDVEAVDGLDCGVILGEGPLWDAQRSVLWWVDIVSGHLYRFDPGLNKSARWDLGGFVSAVATTAEGRLLLALQDGVALFDPESSAVETIAPIESQLSSNRLNDAKVDRTGRLWAGTMNVDGVGPVGSLYRVDQDLSCRSMVEGVTISNGIGWSPDESLMYYVDSPTGRVDVFDFEPLGGNLARRRPFVTVPAGHGNPDGLTVDAEGHVWLALYGGSALLRYAPDGRLVDTLALPVTNVTSCTFGGAELDTLYITTSSDGLSVTERRRQPLAGALFRASPGVHGLPTPDFQFFVSSPESASQVPP